MGSMPFKATERMNAITEEVLKMTKGAMAALLRAFKAGS